MATRDYFSDLEGFGSGTATPSDVFHTPRPSMSRRSSRPSTSRSRGDSSSPPPIPSSSPPPMPGSASTSRNDDSFHSGLDTQNDGDFLSDPRRFTPTLHASLVSEILNLRRELDSKHKFIESLEGNLKNARDEKDDMAEKYSQCDKDRRSVRRQFQQLEHGTLAALEELAKDRDGAKTSSVDLKIKLEDAQRKVKILEEDSERRHGIWEKEKHSWDSEKRGYERRVHITETRLKAVLEELAAHHEAALHQNSAHHEEEDITRDSGLGDESDTASVQCSPARKVAHHRSLSTSSRRSMNRILRFSTQSVAGFDGSKGNGLSLADELQLDEEDEEDYVEEDDEEDFTEHEIRARKALESRQASYPDEKAKRILGIMSESRGTLQQPVEFDTYTLKSTEREGSFDTRAASFDTRTGSFDTRNLMTPEPQVAYVDTGIQFSPPPSPLAVPTSKGIEELPEISPLTDDQVEANQRKKRVSASSPVVDRGQQMSPIPDIIPTTMVSSASQTLEEPLSPPATPKITSPPDSPLVVVTPSKQPELVSIATQTEPAEEPKSPPVLLKSTNRAPAPTPLPIPAIAIHPPVSAPPSPREPILPPGTKSMGCQTSSDLLQMISVSVQTEEIRTDKRLWKLPPHLLPSYISSNPPTPEGKRRSVSDKSPLAWSSTDKYSPRSPQDIPSSPPPMPSPLVEQRYPGNNDNGPVASGERSDGPRRPFRNSSLFAGFEEDDEEEEELKRNEEETKPTGYSTPSTGRGLKHIRHFGSKVSPVPEDKEVESKPRSEQDGLSYSQSGPSSGRAPLETRASFEKGKLTSLRSGALSKQQSIRRSAMIQSGTVVHSQRSRTPSDGSIGSSQISNKSVGPPFPVPDRASSRKLFPQSKSEGSQSPTPRGGGALFGTRRGPAPRQLNRKDSLRKVRSATVIQRSNSRSRTRSRSPPMMNQNVLAPTFPPLPTDNVPVPRKVYASQRSGEKTLSVHDPNKPDAGKASQGTVIDAIAATMVGEWMWKYVRRRKSFGVPESSQEVMGRPGTDGSVNVTGNGVRHKRWVWLSPYERAVMWSTKQPASNSALLGKSGRKLIIQSVLDVRDDTPLPKNHGIAEPFNRSILILTPARALKFTAMSRERHYTWLTALSFLAHSPLLAPGLDLPQAPDIPSDAETAGRNRGPSLQRAGIRDSVRIAKDKAGRPNPGARILGAGGNSARPSPTIHEYHGTENRGDNEPISDSAEAPTVPRFAHGRKRSATGPRLPTSALRSLAYTQVATPRIPSAASSDYGGNASVSNGGGSLYGGGNSMIASTRTSDASSGPVHKHLIGDIGTVRMEAFVEGRDGPMGRDSQDSGDILGAAISSGRTSRRNNRWSGSGSDPRRSGVVYGEEFDSFDPFRGF